jgi:hypothetical protein
MSHMISAVDFGSHEERSSLLRHVRSTAIACFPRDRVIGAPTQPCHQALSACTHRFLDDRAFTCLGLRIIGRAKHAPLAGKLNSLEKLHEEGTALMPYDLLGNCIAPRKRASISRWITSAKQVRKDSTCMR